MRTSRYFDAVLVTAVLAGTAIMVYDVMYHFVLGALPHGFFLRGQASRMVPDQVSAWTVGLLLALVASMVTPRWAVAVSMSATVPWIFVHVGTWAVYGATRLWPFVLADVAAMLIATFVFAKLLGTLAMTRPPAGGKHLGDRGTRVA